MNFFDSCRLHSNFILLLNNVTTKEKYMKR